MVTRKDMDNLSKYMQYASEKTNQIYSLLGLDEESVV